MVEPEAAGKTGQNERDDKGQQGKVGTSPKAVLADQGIVRGA